MRVEKRANKNVKIRLLFSETETAKQNQKFPFHFFFRFAAEGWGEETQEKCKEIFGFCTRESASVSEAHIIGRQDSARNAVELCSIPSAERNFRIRSDPRSYFLYSKISPGWHSKALQIASKVPRRIAFAFPFFNIEMLAIVIPTFSASSVTLIFRFANITSMLMMIAILVRLHH